MGDIDAVLSVAALDAAHARSMTTDGVRRVRVLLITSPNNPTGNLYGMVRVGVHPGSWSCCCPPPDVGVASMNVLLSGLKPL